MRVTPTKADHAVRLRETSPPRVFASSPAPTVSVSTDQNLANAMKWVPFDWQPAFPSRTLRLLLPGMISVLKVRDEVSNS